MRSRAFVSQSSPIYSELVSRIADLARVEGEDRASRAFAEATHEIYYQQFQSSRRVKRSTRKPCLAALFGKKCGYDYGKPHTHCGTVIPCAPPGNDHATMWTRDGKVVAYVYQPYGLGTDFILRLAELCDKLDLSVIVDTWPSWHFPGHVLTVILTRKDFSWDKEGQQEATNA